MADPRPAEPLTPEQEELVLDLVQFGLDVAGIFEPTPIADGSNALISLGRGDWLGAGLSAIGMLPYFGDVAKLGKLPKYARSIARAIEVAGKDAKFAEYLKPAMARLKNLLDDVPAGALPESMAEVRGKIAKFLDGAPAVAGPVKQAMAKLPADLQPGFIAAMKQPPIKNPRLLAKHPGPIAEDALVRELQQKGFVQVKKGKHAPTGKEDSDIWVRRVFRNNADTFEAVRVDRRNMPPRSGPVPPNAGQAQAANRPFGRAHHTLSQTSSKVPAAQGGGIRTDVQGLPGQLARGARKGDFSHWHLEEFPASPDNLAKYLQGPLPSTKKFDPVGVELDTRKYQNGMLHPDEQRRLKEALKKRRGK
jgi:hypothetical protein